MNPENAGEIWGSGDSGTWTDLCQIVKQRLIVIAVIAAPTSTHQHQPFGQPKVGRMSLRLGVLVVVIAVSTAKCNDSFLSQRPACNLKG